MITTSLLVRKGNLLTPAAVESTPIRYLPTHPPTHPPTLMNHLPPHSQGQPTHPSRRRISHYQVGLFIHPPIHPPTHLPTYPCMHAAHIEF